MIFNRYITAVVFTCDAPYSVFSPMKLFMVIYNKKYIFISSCYILNVLGVRCYGLLKKSSATIK